MSRDCCVALPCGAMGLSAVFDVVFPDHTHLHVLFFISDPLIVSKLSNETHDPKGQENKIYTIVRGRETFHRLSIFGGYCCCCIIELPLLFLRGTSQVDFKIYGLDFCYYSNSLSEMNTRLLNLGHYSNKPNGRNWLIATFNFWLRMEPNFPLSSLFK